MKPKLICLTPVYNEAWILDRFLQCTSLWADRIIIADQGSTDGSIEIAQQYDKVVLVRNPRTEDFNEFSMRSILFTEARKISGDKILLSLDADEILTPNFESPEWDTILNSPKGTVISIKRNNVLSDCTFFEEFPSIKFGYVDDGAEYVSGVIHVQRSIEPQENPELRLNDIQILHYQYMDWERMKMKHRWYQCFEKVHKINDNVSIFRRYHHADVILSTNRKKIPGWWINKYAEKKIDTTSVFSEKLTLWVKEILEYFDEYGVAYFRHLNIWTVNWSETAKSLGKDETQKYHDPRTKIDKAINRYLISTQTKQRRIWVRIVDFLLHKLHY